MNLIYLQAIGLWFVFMVFAILNGIARNSLYQDKMKELTAHQISSFTGIIGFLFIIYFFLKFTKASYSSKDLLLIGFLWLGMTIVFEFLFGHFVAGHSWQRLFQDYNLLAGRLWVLVLLSVLIGPWLIDRVLFK